MVNEVNKIVANLLLSGREVTIGSLGTLFTVRFGAFRASRKSMTPPYRTIEFTAELRGVSLEDEIAVVANISKEQAHDIFEQWLSKVTDGKAVRIEGIGILRQNRFSIDESFAAILNPNGRAPMRLKPKANVGLYIFASLCMIFALSVAGYVYIDNNDISLFGSKEVSIETTPIQLAADQTTQQESTEESAVDTIAMDSLTTQPVAQPEAHPQAIFNADSGEILTTASGMNYVVLGVFSTTENAERAILQAHKLMSDLHYSVYHYGDKYMVSLYNAPSRSECQEFVNSVGNSFQDLWIYSRK